MYIRNGSETATAAVLCSLKIKKGGKNEIYQGLPRNGDEHGKNRKKLYCRSVLRGSKDLRVLESCGGRRSFSGHVRLMQRPESGKTRRPAAAAVELERQHSGERRKKMEATSDQRLMGRAIYKMRLISGREKRGGHDVVISP